MSELDNVSLPDPKPSYRSDMTDMLLTQTLTDLNRSVAKLNAKLDALGGQIEELKTLLRK